MTHDVRRIEEFTLSAWPALQQVLLDGWVLRFANGYTRRSNSVNPLYPGAVGDVHHKLRECEHLYAAAGLPVTLKLTDASVPEHLESVLQAEGYVEADGASVQLCDLATLDYSNAEERAPDESIRTWDVPAEEWLDAFCAFNDISSRNRATLRAIIDAIALPRLLAAIVGGDGAIVACGLGVCQPPYVGLFDIVTRPDRRRRGLGRRVVTSLLRWGMSCGATTGCLQVMTGNAPAVALYAQSGFAEAYRYRYLVKPIAGP